MGSSSAPVIYGKVTTMSFKDRHTVRTVRTWLTPSQNQQQQQHVRPGDGQKWNSFHSDSDALSTVALAFFALERFEWYHDSHRDVLQGSAVCKSFRSHLLSC